MKYLWSISLMFCLSFQVKGQLLTTISNEIGMVGDTVTLAVTVCDFESLLSFQFSINWDKDDLDFIEVADPYISSTSFSYVSIDQGQIGTFWFDFGLGTTIPDNSILFTISFQVMGSPGDTLPVVFSGIPLVLEAIDANIQNIGVVGENGSIVVPDLIPTEEIDNASSIEVFPNPFEEGTSIHFSCKKGEWGTLLLFNTNGAIINRRKLFFSAGEHTLHLKKELFPSKGSYTYVFELGTLSKSGVLMAY